MGSISSNFVIATRLTSIILIMLLLMLVLLLIYDFFSLYIAVQHLSVIVGRVRLLIEI
jgi:hypothetical protein